MQFFNALVTSLLVATAVALPAPDAQTVEKRACDPEQCRKTCSLPPYIGGYCGENGLCHCA